ncbi:CRISPR-associated helicase Cas3' [Longispora fulva]|uniref:CRISPR-associated endonuclease/helicase Cas3 n=1 Tax=Longispora fulva TaxID=619741 RepID=A0A8J7GGK3_9ACTN|nr:CRISPR-associated helicase Cas3' [Longispora fulva]MBG6136312.1 CRISPR-associated endonuclease/helicase Cas3 [Longispora fulva]
MNDAPAVVAVDYWRFYGVEVRGRVGVLWGKSAMNGGGVMNLLLSHMLDTAAVAERVWDCYLPVRVRRVLDDVAGGVGRGRRFFAWLCGVHDCGKATPAFQQVDPLGTAAVWGSGLTWDRYAVKGKSWRHDKAGAKLLIRVLDAAGWDEAQVDWVWPLIAGHHGSYPSRGQLKAGTPALQGRGVAWEEAQQVLVEVFTRELGFDSENPLLAVEPRVVPPRAVQLQLSGFVVMADWIASDQTKFGGIDDLDRVSMGGARVRAAGAWAELGLRGGWGQLPTPGPQVFQRRFGQEPRPSQRMVLDAVRRMGGSGLVIIEAPMGEGKTKTALVASEVLASRFGADGVFVGMPTQATCDPMFAQVRDWLRSVEPGLESQVALLHGKRMFNKEWRALLDDVGDECADDCFTSVGEDIDGVDEYGMAAFGGHGAVERRAPAEWFLGRKRGLLSPFVVGTIDQLLFAATRTRHVMLRMAGLVGKVVVLDEVHAADVYMSQFLEEGLWWLGQAGVPVVMLSATLPSAQRRALVGAYLAGARSREERDVPDLPEPAGYPSVTAAWLADSGPQFLVDSCSTWRDDVPVTVEILSEAPQPPIASDEPDTISPADQSMVNLLEDRLQDGGCVLVIRNTVPRAQSAYAALKKTFGADVVLLHGRLDAADRAERTEACLEKLGPPSKDRQRPERLIVVATQLAEQSFDVDADLLITDLAPMDLLLQRIGRLHRHEGVDRPARVSVATVVVTGLGCLDPDQIPWILKASEGIYGSYLLLRTAAALVEAQQEGWRIPGQVPQLVEQVYGGGQAVPAAWSVAERAAGETWSTRQRRRAEAAAPYLLTRLGEHANPTLQALHTGGIRESLPEGRFEALVRDGDPTVEVIVVRGDDDAGYRTPSGRSLGPNGEASTSELVEEVLGATVRLPASLTSVVEENLVPLPSWRDHPWLRYSRALVLGPDGWTQLGDLQVTYDTDLGLVVRGGVRPSRGARP